MDGLEQRRRRLGLGSSAGALERHMAAFFDRRATPRTAPHVETDFRHGTEGLLPFAVLARHDQNHPALDAMLEFCERAAAERGGAIRDGSMTTAEGCYTLAYPLAALGRARGDAKLRRMAAAQLLDRIGLLPHGGALYLRASEDGSRTFSNWARGVAWFALGIVRTMEELPADEIPARVREALAWCAGLALRWQNPQGLWHCFLDDPATGWRLRARQASPRRWPAGRAGCPNRNAHCAPRARRTPSCCGAIWFPADIWAESRRPTATASGCSGAATA